MKKVLTISVDDGHPDDEKTAALLKKYGLKATFYVPQKNPERALLSDQALKAICSDADFELGGHTVSHLSLHKMSDARAQEEISGGKKWLEDLTGQSIPAFCYPQGKFNRRTPSLVKKAGFAGARTCFFNRSDFPSDPYLWGVSTHAYSHSPAVQVRHALIEGNFLGAFDFFRIHGAARQWTKHFERALHHVSLRGGVAHLYFHSWEISEQGQWKELEVALKLAAQFQRLERLTNGELFLNSATSALDHGTCC